jgi:branched-chain amino acid transport system substrate-binding protein
VNSFKYSAATAVTSSFSYRRALAEARPIKVGVVGAKTGPLAPGAAVTHFPPYRLWAHEINNERGGIKTKDGPRKVELIEYDDRTQPPDAIKAVERLAAVDKVDWIGGVYATGFNLACAPTFDKYGYPQVTVACITDQAPALSKKYPNFFMFNTSTTNYATTAIGVLRKLKDSGQIGNKVAVVNVGDDFGIELANAGRPIFKSAGFDIVYDKSYPLGTQDLAPVIKAAKAANPDAFVAWSYPPDTFGLAAGQDRKPGGESLLLCDRLRLPGLRAEEWRRYRKRTRGWRYSRHAGNPRLVQKAQGGYRGRCRLRRQPAVLLDAPDDHRVDRGRRVHGPDGHR